MKTRIHQSVICQDDLNTETEEDGIINRILKRLEDKGNTIKDVKLSPIFIALDDEDSESAFGMVDVYNVLITYTLPE